MLARCARRAYKNGVSHGARDRGRGCPSGGPAVSQPTALAPRCPPSFTELSFVQSRTDVDEYSTPQPLSRARYKSSTEYLDIAEPRSTISEKKCFGSESVSCPELPIDCWLSACWSCSAHLRALERCRATRLQRVRQGLNRVPESRASCCHPGTLSSICVCVRLPLGSLPTTQLSRFSSSCPAI